MFMGRYFDERKGTVLAKLLPPHNMTVAELAAREGLSQLALYNRRNEAKLKVKSRAKRNNSMMPNKGDPIS